MKTLKSCLSLLLTGYLFGCSTTSAGVSPDNVAYKICITDAEKYSQRSKELTEIHARDQADRVGGVMAPGAVFRDRDRRKRVSEIFAEGCFDSADDFFHAAIVFQHGDKPEHYMTAFLWFKESSKLGRAAGKRMSALAIDRYLVSKTNKQLFGSQASIVPGETCWCLQSVEETFPDRVRMEYLGEGITLQKQLEWVDSMNAGKNCPKNNVCRTNLRPSPRGTVIGFW